MSRRILLVILVLLAAPLSYGQVSRILGFPDRVMSSSRIGSVSSLQVPRLPVPDTVAVAFPLNGSRAVSKDYEFFNYLLDNELELDAKTLLSGAYAKSDTLDFLRGKVLFSEYKLSQASGLFSKVPASSPFGPEAFYYRVVALSTMGDYDTASVLLSSSLPKTFTDGGNYSELTDFQAAGLALLKGSRDEWSGRSAGFTYSDFALAESERVLAEIGVSRFSKRNKSAGVAALASALVPGAGKVYAGRFGEGVAAFLTVGSLGAVTAENWKKHGTKDWRTILAGSLCATFYLGNIYGSYLSVSIENDERTDAENMVILYHLHLPLRTIFR